VADIKARLAKLQEESTALEAKIAAAKAPAARTAGRI
jgi:outer membrane murein-binding lipoprotein Lpp